MRAEPAIAITGAAGAAGRAVRDAIARRRVPVERVRLLEQSSEEAIISEYAGQAVLIGVLEPESLADRDLVFLSGSEAESAACLLWPRKESAVFVDLSGASKTTGAPIVALGVNDEVLDGRPRTLAAPHPIAFALASVLAPIERLCGIDEAEAVVLRPVSDFGEAGIEELHKQTVGLLNFTETPHQVFDRQMAFNLLPQSALERVMGETGLETRIAREIAGALAWDSPRLTLKVLVAPVFHGHSFLVHVGTRRRADRAVLLEGLAAKGLGVGPSKTGGVSPVEVGGQDDLRVVDVAPDGLTAGGWWLWIIGSDVAGAAARNAVDIGGRALGVEVRGKV